MASSITEKLKNIGPGALVAAGFVGPGTVTTCTVSGASYGCTMLWALLFATVATIIFQEMAARVGIVTQEGLGENIRDRISHPVLKWIAIVIVIIAIFIGNTAYETGNITGGILGIQAVVNAPMIPIVIVLGVLAFAVMWVGSYKLVEKILTGIVIFMGLVFLITAFASPVDWGAVVAGLFTPSLPEGQAGAKGILTAVGLIGTTIVPYNLFLHASGASERFKDPEQIADARFDCVLSIGLGGIISMAILVCAAANMHAAGITVTNGKDMAVALQPLLGNWATVLIGIGLYVSKTLYRGIYPLLAAAQTIPLITIAPLFMIWFGFEPLGKIVIVAVFGVFPVAVQTCRGMLAVPQFYEDVALTCGATRAWALWHVKLRVAARQVFGGLRISAAYVFGTAVTAEYLGAMNGLGIWLQAAFNSFRTPLIFSATIMVVALTALLLTIISLAERLLLGPDDTIAFNDDGE